MIAATLDDDDGFRHIEEMPYNLTLTVYRCAYDSGDSVNSADADTQRVTINYIPANQMCFGQNTYFDGDTCGAAIFSVTQQQPSNGILCDNDCETLNWYALDGDSNTCFFVNVASTSNDVGEYTVTRTKGSESENMKLYICEIAGIESFFASSGG